jgi:hypothetical protein
MSKPVVVKWKDAYGGGEGWTSEYDGPAEPAEPVTVGFLLPSDHQPGYVVIADTVLEYTDGTVFYSGLTHIPSGMVIDVTVL